MRVILFSDPNHRTCPPTRFLSKSRSFSSPTHPTDPQPCEVAAQKRWSDWHHKTTICGYPKEIHQRIQRKGNKNLLHAKVWYLACSFFAHYILLITSYLDHIFCNSKKKKEIIQQQTRTPCLTPEESDKSPPDWVSSAPSPPPCGSPNPRAAATAGRWRRPRWPRLGGHRGKSWKRRRLFWIWKDWKVRCSLKVWSLNTS